MSFSKTVKQEICSQAIERPCCVNAACYGIACFARLFSAKGVSLHTENAFIAQWAKDIYHRAGIEGKVYVQGRESARTYEFVVGDAFEVEKMLALLGHTGEETAVRIHADNFMCDQCLAAFAGAAFVSCGTVVDPAKGYNLEYVAGRYMLLEDFTHLLREKGFAPKRANRKGANILYFKSSEQIEDMLTYMGAVKASLEIMNRKVYKDFRNKANRIANCETANIDKTVAATQQMLRSIRALKAHGALDSLPETLQEAARLREANPEFSLKELTELCAEPVSKSGFSHRLRRIAKLAEKYETTQPDCKKE